MKRIYKYVLGIVDSQELSLPLGSKVLSVEEQYGNIVLYALVDTEWSELEIYSVIIHGTGHQANDIENYCFLGTVKLADGQLIFHVFYRKE